MKAAWDDFPERRAQVPAKKRAIGVGVGIALLLAGVFNAEAGLLSTIPFSIGIEPATNG
jgi:hypothetical protein